MRYLTPLLVLSLLGCDQSAGLDPQPRVTFTRLAAIAACPSGDAEVDVSLHLMSGRVALGPDEVWPRARRTLAELVTPDAVAFFDGPFARRPSEVRYVPTGGPERADDPLLVMLTVDQSSSLIGRDPYTGEVDLERASDPRDVRNLYLTQLVEQLPPDAFVSVASFSGDFASDDTDCLTPTRDRARTAACLRGLQHGEDGLTPLADGLALPLRRVVPTNPDLNPVVVLFTDGVEDGDNSTATLADVRDAYVEQGVPLVALDLQPSPLSPWPQGPSAELSAFACATGGEYLFFERHQDLDPSRADVVAHRLRGSWKARARAHLDRAVTRLDGELSVSVVDTERSASLAHIWVGE